MSRLTDRKNSMAFIKNAGVYTCSRICKEEDFACTGCPIQEAFDKLAHYEDLEEAGRLIELPCKVGDTVWICEMVKKEYIVYDCEVAHNFDAVLFKDLWNIKVFPTKAEAEAKLAELKGGSDE